VGSKILTREKTRLNDNEFWSFSNLTEAEP
jgi:hypothetical protein